MAFGELGMTSSEFWDSSPRDLDNRYKGYLKTQQEEWERTRWMVFRMKTTTEAETKGGSMSVQDIAVFPWEEKQVKAKDKPLDPEKQKKLEAAMDAHAKNQ